MRVKGTLSRSLYMTASHSVVFCAAPEHLKLALTVFDSELLPPVEISLIIYNRGFRRGLASYCTFWILRSGSRANIPVV